MINQKEKKEKDHPDAKMNIEVNYVPSKTQE
jgi:hypothetical protein